VYQTSEGFREIVEGDGRTFYARIVSGNDVITSGFKKIFFSGGTNGSDTIALGGAVSNYIIVELHNQEIMMENKEIELSIGLKVDDAIEYVPCGFYTVQKPSSDGEVVTFTAYDRMLKFERLYVSNLTYPAPADAVLNEISELIGVAIATAGISVTINSKPAGYTCREILSIIGQLTGTFAMINRAGSVEFRWYSSAGITVQKNRYWAPFERNELDYTIEKLECAVGLNESENDETEEESTETEDSTTIVLTAGEGAKGISFSNEFMTQSILNKVYQKIGGYSYRPASVKFMGDIRLDPGDIIVVNDGTQDYTIPLMTLEWTFDGGLSTSVTAVGNTDEEESINFQGPTARTLDQVQAELLTVGKLVANKIDAIVVEAEFLAVSKELTAVNAKIDNLDVDYLTAETADIKYATISQANITDAAVKDLTAEYGEFRTAVVDDFTAVNASITDLVASQISAAYLSANYVQIDLANIEAGSITTAMISTGAIETAQIADGSITDAKIVELTANKITAGTLSVERLEIRGSETSLVYALNNITNALQAQSVDTLNGEILTERTITADRIVARSITADEIAVNTITANNIASNAITTDKLNASAVTATKIATNAVTAEKINVTSLEAIVAKIGGFNIESNALHNGTTTLAGAVNSVYLGTDGISCGNAFKVEADGTLSASKGNVGGWNVGTSGLYNDSIGTGKAGFVSHPSSAIALYVGTKTYAQILDSINSGTDDYPEMCVTTSGGIMCNEIYLRGMTLFSSASGYTGNVGYFILGNIGVVFGRKVITPVKDTPTGLAITFPIVFKTRPDVIANAMTAVMGTTVAGASAAGITTTGCTLYATRSNATDTTVGFIAIGFVL